MTFTRPLHTSTSQDNIPSSQVKHPTTVERAAQAAQATETSGSITPVVIDLTLDNPVLSSVAKRPKKRRRTESESNEEVRQSRRLSFNELVESPKTFQIPEPSLQLELPMPSESQPSMLIPEMPSQMVSQDTDGPIDGEHVPESLSLQHPGVEANHPEQEVPPALSQTPNINDQDVLDNAEVLDMLEHSFMSPDNDPSKRPCAFCRCVSDSLITAI